MQSSYRKNKRFATTKEKLNGISRGSSVAKRDNATLQKKKKRSIEKETMTNIPYLNTSDIPYFIAFSAIIFITLTTIQGLYQYFKNEHEKVINADRNDDPESVRTTMIKYLFYTAIPILFLSVWLGTILTKLRSLLSIGASFLLKNMLYVFKPEVFVFFFITFIAYRMMLSIPIIFKYIHSFSEALPFGGALFSLILIGMFIFIMMFLIIWVIMIFSYDISDSMVKLVLQSIHRIFHKNDENQSKKNKDKNLNTNTPSVPKEKKDE